MIITLTIHTNKITPIEHNNNESLFQIYVKITIILNMVPYLHLNMDCENYKGISIQLNLVNSKSSSLEVLFHIISSLNYTEVDIKIYNPQK